MTSTTGKLVLRDDHSVVAIRTCDQVLCCSGFDGASIGNGRLELAFNDDSETFWDATEDDLSDDTGEVQYWCSDDVAHPTSDLVLLDERGGVHELPVAYESRIDFEIGHEDREQLVEALVGRFGVTHPLVARLQALRMAAPQPVKGGA